LNPGLISNVIKLFQQSIGFGYDSGIQNEVKVFSLALSQLKIEKPVILDVGANLGDWSKAIKAHFPVAEIHAFEPSGVTYIELTKALQEFANISTHNFGFGEIEQSQPLFYDNEKSGMASLYRRDLRHISIEFDKFEKVEIKRLDNWLAESKIKANIIKIDVEGHELSVLRGLGEQIHEFKLIQFEFGGTDVDSRTFFQDFWNLFRNTNFTVYRLTPRGKIPIRSYSERDEVFSFTTYLAINE
jgi:FkbM family methyltransferase